MRDVIVRVFGRSATPAAEPPPPPARQTTPWTFEPMRIPALTSRNLEYARLYAERTDMVRDLGIPRGGNIAEVGVGLGDFSEALLNHLSPAHFAALDTFILHTIPEVWGRKTSEVFEGGTHRAFYERKLAAWSNVLDVREGFSQDHLATFPDHHFHMIYIDADHLYEGVKRDAEIAVRKLRPDGVLIFNDYIMFDYLSSAPYGVVPVVNELAVNAGWRVVGFALQPQMFCDIALRPPLG